MGDWKLNYMVICDRICTVPVVKIIPTAGEKIYICKYVVCVPDGMAPNELEKANFYECVAFGNCAEKVVDGCSKGTKVVAVGKMVNHFFKDGNGTPHFTNIFVTTHLEVADPCTARSSSSLERASAAISEFKEVDEAFQKICSQGFLCVDENDYYNLAVGILRPYTE